MYLKHLNTRFFCLIGFLFFFIPVTSLSAQIASYPFNSDLNDQINAYNPSSVVGTPDFSSGEFVALDSGEYFVLPDALYQAFDNAKSLEIDVRFMVEGNWQATPAIDGFGEEARIILTTKDEYDQRFGGFDITARQWEGRLWIITTYGDGLTYDQGMLSEGKLDFVAEIETDTWYDLNLKIVFDEVQPYIQYIVNGVLSVSFFDHRLDYEGFRQTVNQQTLIVGSTLDNSIYERSALHPSLDLKINHLEFFSPASPGDPVAVENTLLALIDHMNGAEAYSNSQLDSMQTVFVSNWDDDVFDEKNPTIISYIETFAETEGYVFTQKFRSESPEDFDPLRAIQFQLEQWILDNQYTASTVSDMEGLMFADHELMPGEVSSSAERLSGATFTVDGNYQTNPGFYLNQEDYVRRPTGYFVPAGELVEVTVPDEAIGKGLSLYVGAHRKNLQEGWSEFRRFPRISTTFPLETKTITVANPFGGGIYITVPDGSLLGDLNFNVSGAVKAPFYSTKEGYENSLTDFISAIQSQEVPYVDVESDNFMMTISNGMASQMNDPDSILTIWDQSFDAINIALGRPEKRFRSEYLIQDRQTHVPFTAAPAAYPMSLEVYAYPYESIIQQPIDVERGRSWYNGPIQNTFNYIIFHEYGHLHNIPTLSNEQETNVHIPAVAAYSQVMGESIDSAFVYALSQRLNLEQATFDWIFTSNFINGERIGPESPWNNPWDQLLYQSRGLVKLVDIAKMYGWEALGNINRYFYEYRLNNPNWDPYGLQDDEFIRAASEVMGFNMAPHFEFHGIIPSQQLVAELSTMDVSNVIKDRILHYRFSVPANADEFNAVYNRVVPKISQEFHVPRWDAWKNEYDEQYAEDVINRIDAILSKYYELSVEDLNDAPRITGLTEALSIEQNSSITLSLEDLVVEDRDHTYPNDHSLIILEGDNYTIDGMTIVPSEDFAGVLTVPVKVSDGVEESEAYDIEIEVSVVLSTEDQQFNYVVYPNPTKDGVLNLEGIPLGSEYSIRDLSGRLVQRGTLVSNEIKLTGGKGIYLLKVTSATGTRLKKIIFQE